MDLRRKIVWCIVGNFITVILVMIPIIVLNDGSTYFKFGPNSDSVLISVTIDTDIKYIAVLGLIAVINIIKVLSEEIGMPILGFNIYNPDKKVITEFSKLELQVYGNLMFMLAGLRGIFTIMVTVTQFDIALWSLIVSEVTSMYTIRTLLNEKEFKHMGYEEVEIV
jgi:hypothetical protein